MTACAKLLRAVRRQLPDPQGREWVIFAPQNLLRDRHSSGSIWSATREQSVSRRKRKGRSSRCSTSRSSRAATCSSATETLGRTIGLFETVVSKKWRLYRRVGAGRHGIVDFPIAGRRIPAPGGGCGRPVEPLPTSYLVEVARQALAHQFAPASVMVDPATGSSTWRHRYLAARRPRPGMLLAMARDGLRPKLRAVLQSAGQAKRPSTVTAWMGEGGVRRPVSVTVSPVRAPVPSLLS